MGQSLNLPDADATETLAASLADALPEDASGWTVLLEGELGAGKSTFARAMLRALGHHGPVPSPTYTLVEPYTLANFTVYHIDLYRIESVNELEFLGWSDLQDGLILIEWPERVPQLGKEADIRVKLRYQGDGRVAELSGLTVRGKSAVASVTVPGAEVSS